MRTIEVKVVITLSDDVYQHFDIDDLDNNINMGLESLAEELEENEDPYTDAVVHLIKDEEALQ